MSSLSSKLVYFQVKIIETISWIYVTFGLIGCILNVIIFSKKKFRSTSCFIYFLVASVSMLCQLSIYAVPSIYSIYYRNPLSYIVIYCKIRMYLIKVTNLTYRWSYAIASFDRYATSSSNPRLRRLASVPVAIRILSIFITIWFIWSIDILILYDIKSNSCNIFNNTGGTLFSNISLTIIGAIIPLVIMIVCTLLIQKNLKEKREHRQVLVNQQISTINDQTQRKRDQQTLIMLFAQIIIYITVTIPWIAYNINNIISPYVPNKSADRVAIENFILVVAGAFAFLFPAISFYVYILTSKMFRDSVINLFKSLFLYKFFTKNCIEPTSTNQN